MKQITQSFLEGENPTLTEYVLWLDKWKKFNCYSKQRAVQVFKAKRGENRQWKDDE